MTTWLERQHRFDPKDKLKVALTGLIFDIQRFSIHDGPGIRTTVFLKGCPLRCLWCQNPESMARQPEITYIATNCIECDKCLAVCPEQAIQPANGKGRTINRQLCTLCGDCIKICYAGALNIIGRYLTVPEVLAEVERDRAFYVKSGGGVTFSGGEPTAQAAFLEEACRQAQSHRLHTALDTCGYVQWKTFRSILRYVDLVLFDIKHMDSNQHRRLTGVGNELILANLRRIADLGVSVYVRTPLVPGYNDSPENIRATAAFIAKMPHIRQYDILPYHRLGEPKWRQLDQPYQLQGLGPPSREHVYALADVAREYNIEVNVGG
ncbi:MAG: glycyl-radical enzyme activating protein [Anaerolineales bacterium]|nr:glycyl-radical enzyme activating protein [Anaerolineales bacterium]